jgi:S-adenosyl-L-methionine hydrolase (adenosine-forming)
MPIVTLTTDWIQDDYYTGAIKGKLIDSCPALNIVDIIHKIPAFNIARAAFVLKTVSPFSGGNHTPDLCKYRTFSEESLLAIEYEGHFFIGNDNGIFGLIFREQPSAIVELQSPANPGSFPPLRFL